MLKKHNHLLYASVCFAPEGKSNLIGGTKPTPTAQPDPAPASSTSTTSVDPADKAKANDPDKTLDPNDANNPGRTVDANNTPPESVLRAEQTPPATASPSTTQSTVTATVPVPTSSVQSDQMLAAQSAAEEAAVELAKRQAEADAAQQYYTPFSDDGDEYDSVLGDENESPVRPVAEREVFQAYKHRRISRFSVGDFHFIDHTLLVYSSEDNDRFLELYDGLEAIDRNSIVKWNWKAAQTAEQPMNRGGVRTTTGMASTSNFKDPKTIR